MNTSEIKLQNMIVLGFPEYEAQAQRFASVAGCSYATLTLHHFPDGESKLQLPAKLPDHIILCRSLNRPNDKLVELILAAAGARDQGSKTVSLLAPYLCYMRQDKAFHQGEIISQKIIGKCLADYFDSILTVDAHLHRIHHLRDAIPIENAVNISATEPMAHFIQNHVDQPYLLGPDGESEQWVAAIAAQSQMDYGVALKERYGDKQVNVHVPEGDYQERNIVLVDDVASTGKTLLEAAKGLQKYKPASISVLVTHALFVDDAIPQLRKAGVSNIWSCDSIPHPTNMVQLADILAANSVMSHK